MIKKGGLFLGVLVLLLVLGLNLASATGFGFQDAKSNLGRTGEKAGLDVKVVGRDVTYQNQKVSSNNAKGFFVVFVGNWIEYALQVIATLVVIYIIYGGYLWLTAGGNSEQAGKGQKAVRNAVIGLVLVLSAYSIIFVALNWNKGL